MNSTLEPSTWGFNVFYGMSIVTLPLYFIILVCLVRLRQVSKSYRTTFYSLLLQHCIADIISMLGYIALTPAREISVIRQFYFDYQEYYIAAATYNIIYVSLYIRCIGILLLSLQRYFVITSPHSNLTIKIQTSASWKVVLVYWILPLLLSVIVLKDSDMYFNDVVDMNVIIEKSITQRNTTMALLVVSFVCIISSFAYGALFFFIRKNTRILSRSLRREVRLAFQVFVLLFAFFAILIFYAILNYCSRAQMTAEMFYLRTIYPMLSGFLSYMNPYCILLLNHDLARQVVKSVSCKEYENSEVQVSGILSNSTKQQLPTTARPSRISNENRRTVIN
ncbi:G-protein coupled receptors family 1 profile domain-containing protein [Caenorhabditis elegans]|uniref:G-protein coupled receptors family 1 profile domain-containing protein n=1 Tax=Caenorhabditis elegans TaxID=6239 RepID=Q86DM3_CAEEL|nr:G-protein coupled receptors family 1 profile domain-containing protein [Caenorhabditis elegans]CCD74187.1 G-protein coupled receptors family 1 profile domain-containing protein [Caenorhabditis elegans]|eukprot:NP_872113.1 Serpentine Receptor, class V [Caenorhabditis elegans]